MIGNNKISKRDFLKYGFCGMCGAAIGFSPVSMLAGRKMKPLDLKLGGSKDLWKWSKEAYHYIQTPRGLRCLTCPNECVVLPDEPGDCRTHVAFENKLYTIAYGNPCAVHVDPIEKKPLYHFLPSTKAFSIATAGCNLSCLNCQNWNISQASPEETTNYDLMPAQVIEECLNYKCRSIAYTYSDPIAFYEYTYDTAKRARARGIKNVIITAGYINEKPLRQFCEVVDAANVDLKSFSDEVYQMLNAGKLKPILDTLKILKQEGVWLEITNLIVPSWTDDFDMIKKMCDWLYDNDLYDCPLHFSRFHPQYKLTNLPATPESTLKQAREIAINAGIKFVYIGNVPGSGAENTYCPNCEKLLIERKGFFVSQNHVKDSKCEFCDESIPGIWE